MPWRPLQRKLLDGPGKLLNGPTGWVFKGLVGTIRPPTGAADHEVNVPTIAGFVGKGDDVLLGKFRPFSGH